MKFDFYISEDRDILKYLFPDGACSIGQLEEYEETKEAIKDTEKRKELINFINSGEV